jgi:hypothetical protein
MITGGSLIFPQEKTYLNLYKSIISSTPYKNILHFKKSKYKAIINATAEETKIKR